MRVGLSVSGNAEQLAEHGFTPAGMNRFTVRLARALLAEGAGLAFGHDWRAEGVMEAVAALALHYSLPLQDEEGEPLIVNLLPWPADRSSTDPELLQRLEGIVEVRRAGLPPELGEHAEQVRRMEPTAGEYQYLRAQGLSRLRRQLNAICGARVAIGGKLSKFQGRLPGIVEEVVLGLRSARPVYLAGLFGGAARLLGQVLLDAANPHRLFEGTRLERLYQQHAYLGTTAGDADFEPDALVAELRDGQLRQRLLDNGLTQAENRQLLETTLEEEVILLTLKGLKQMATRRSSHPRDPEERSR
jgi:hypothetical protein